MILDFHSHILPSMDDGSTGVEMTKAMLDEAGRQGIDILVASSHFYPEDEDISKFLARRKSAKEKLLEVYDESIHPKIALGAEVAYYYGISRSPQIPSLCVDGTNYLLVEMPFLRWTQTEVEEIIALKERQCIFPVVAHIERYIKYQKKHVLRDLIENGIMIQSNASFFIERKTQKQALSFIDKEIICFLGSDCHNLDTRPENLIQAVDIIRERLGEERLNAMLSVGSYCMQNAKYIKIN